MPFSDYPNGPQYVDHQSDMAIEWQSRRQEICAAVHLFIQDWCQYNGVVVFWIFRMARETRLRSIYLMMKFLEKMETKSHFPTWNTLLNWWSKIIAHSASFLNMLT